MFLIYEGEDMIENVLQKTKDMIRKLLVGVDVGSTTTKVVVMEEETEEVLYSSYKRHNAAQVKSVRDVIRAVAEHFPGEQIRMVMTGSGAKPIAMGLDVPFIQEVVANSVALKKDYENVGTAIELGGQDAKIIFFGRDSQTGELNVADMRMNGSCAGGTGAFIDEVASLLKVPIEEFNAMAEKGTCVYDISGRCGVYAKTDIQPLLNQGAAKEDIALSAFHAIAKQTIGGLAQGLDIEKPVIFEGGPLTFNPVLIRVFAERLMLFSDEILIPEHPEIMIAYGAALSLKSMFADSESLHVDQLLDKIDHVKIQVDEKDKKLSAPFFRSQQEREAFLAAHKMHSKEAPEIHAGDHVRAYLGIDSGSTTTKFVLMDEEEKILDVFYASNEGDPLTVARNALIALNHRYRDAGASLEILAAGTTGYGELLFHKAFHAECHMVETVAHAKAASHYVDDVSFILDIGGQDMKAIWLDHGIITNIVVNEACSSGCGSFLESFAANLHIPVERIAEEAFSSTEPAALGSRCTVFMNSSIITEQRNGKAANDIMAGLCRSIIENVFTKVIRISNVESLGDKIVVQGGTFRNDAVLCAMEQYLGKSVTRAPLPGLMGAIGAALITRDRMKSGQLQPSFIGLDAMEHFSYEQTANYPCPFCENHCKRTIVTFSDGQSWVTNNRCERGEILGDPKDAGVRDALKAKQKAREEVPNLFVLREKLLFKEYEVPELLPDQGITIGIPRVLSYWDTAPFWTSFWRALGFKVKLSPKSTRKIYEEGLHAVTSDTVCFPAKLVHGHIRALARMGVDRIFMPSITTVPSENTEETSESMCAVVKGYPIVMRNSDNPDKRYDIPFDTPLFHWHHWHDRDRQITIYMKDHYNIPAAVTRKAVQAADEAQKLFLSQLQEAGARIMQEAREAGRYAVVLASRPYQNDALVNHDLPQMLTSMGIPVLTVDSLPEANQVKLDKLRIDVVNNYHARMLSSAILAAEHDYLEYIQIVSFGCGHDAYLSDEIIRTMHKISRKTPLVLKLDESDIQGPLRIRVRSFIETIDMKRGIGYEPKVKPLTDPYEVKFTKEDVKERLVLIPNTSHAFCRIMSAAMSTQGIRAVPLEVGREEAIRLGKQYVHNDICFPAQIVVGEILAALRSGKYDLDKTGVAMAKYIGDCRLTHYTPLLRKAMDDAGFKQVPIVTNDDKDAHDIHPGFKMNLIASMRLATALPMIDVLEELLRKIRPYEIVPGSANQAFDKGMDALVEGIEQAGIRGAKKGFARAIDLMCQVRYDRSHLRPTVLIVGEYLLNFHPGANHDIEDYLERNGFEIIEARMTDVIQKTYFYQNAQVKEYHIRKKFADKALLQVENSFFSYAHDVTAKIAKKHPLYEGETRMEDLVKDSDSIIHHTFDAGEGVLIPGEIIHHAKHGCKSFVILQPFGCLPNHVVGRGITKKLKEMFPDVQILPLDYDPDVSFANIENRLQMLIMNAKR